MTTTTTTTTNPRRRWLRTLAVGITAVTLVACSSDDADDADAAEGATSAAADAAVSGAETSPGEASGGAAEDVENPIVFGYEVDGPAGTTVVVVSSLVAAGADQGAVTATWSITDRPRWQLYTNWVEAGQLDLEVTEGGPATVTIIRARPVDPDDPFAGIDVAEELGSVEVAPGSTAVLTFP